MVCIALFANTGEVFSVLLGEFPVVNFSSNDTDIARAREERDQFADGFALIGTPVEKSSVEVESNRRRVLCTFEQREHGIRVLS